MAHIFSLSCYWFLEFIIKTASHPQAHLLVGQLGKAEMSDCCIVRHLTPFHHTNDLHTFCLKARTMPLVKCIFCRIMENNILGIYQHIGR